MQHPSTALNQKAVAGQNKRRWPDAESRADPASPLLAHRVGLRRASKCGLRESACVCRKPLAFRQVSQGVRHLFPHFSFASNGLEQFSFDFRPGKTKATQVHRAVENRLMPPCRQRSQISNGFVSLIKVTDVGYFAKADFRYGPTSRLLSGE
jgi:hypothetical protein